MMKKTTRALLVDKHPLLRLGLRDLVENQLELHVCGEASNLPQAIQQFISLKPELVIMEIALEAVGHGLDLIRRLRKHHAGSAILVLSACNELLFAERALMAGASGYVSKEKDVKEILKAIQCVLQGKVYLSSKATDNVLETHLRPDAGGNQEPAQCLSERELAIFELLGKGWLSRQIAGTLHISVKTVETHYSHIKAKLHVENGTALRHRATVWCLENL